MSCLKYYYTTEYKFYTLQHPCIIEESNIYQTYQDGIIRISKAPPHFGPACCYTGTPFFEPRYSNISLCRHLISERRFPSFSSNERHKTFMGSPAIRGLGSAICPYSKGFRMNGGPHLKGSRRPRKKVTFCVHPQSKPLAVQIVLRGSKGFRV